MGFSKVFNKKDVPTLDGGFKFLFEKGIAALNVRDQQKRDKKFFHISSIGYCLKAVYFDAIHGKEQELGFLKKVNFGTSLHELYQKYLAMSGNLYGGWYCKRCKHKSAAGFSPEKCNCKEEPNQEYSEFHFMNSKYKVSGHPDGFLKIIKPKLTLIEIKTISPYYNIKEGPQQVDKYVPEHKRQCNFYLHVMQDASTFIEGVDKDLLLALLDVERYLLVYHDKGKDDTITYPFSADRELYERDLARVALYHKCVKEGKEPPAEPEMKKCKYCAHINKCNGVDD